MKPRVLVLGADRSDPPPGIEPANAVVDLDFTPDSKALEDAIADAEGLFSWRADRGRLQAAWPRAGKLRWIQLPSAGVDALLFPELVESDVILTNARGVFEEPIAEWVVGAMLAFATGLHTSIVDQARRHWGGDRRTERLAGRRLLVVGPGPIGRQTAARARMLGMEVEATGRTERTDDLLGRVGTIEDLPAALGRADFVLDALPLTAGTRHLFDALAFAAMRRTARFVNVGRGATVDEPALIEALAGGRIAGAALDVFEDEPLPPESPLWNMPNVIISPHICGDILGWEEQVVGIFVDNAGRWVRGEPLVNVVDKRLGHPPS